MKKKELVNLEKIHEEYGVSVWDTCALIGYLPVDGGRGIQDKYRFTDFLKSKLDDLCCFIPECVEYEYCNGSNPYWFKKTKQGRLISEFEKRGMVLSVYNSPLGRKVEKITEKWNSRNSMGITDWTVIAWGCELIDFFGSVAIISNDIRHIGKFWKNLVHKKIVYKNELGFFPRRELDLYERFI